MSDEMKLPQGVTNEEWTEAVNKVCLGGEDAGAGFFGRHPRLGFACAITIQCDLNKALAQIATLTKKLEAEERAVLEEIANRDEWEDKATQLADNVGEYFDVPVGEHSSANCPIEEARKILNGEYKTNGQQDKQIAELTRAGGEFAGHESQAKSYQPEGESRRIRDSHANIWLPYWRACKQIMNDQDGAIRSLKAELAALRDGATMDG